MSCRKSFSTNISRWWVASLMSITVSSHRPDPVASCNNCGGGGGVWISSAGDGESGNEQFIFCALLQRVKSGKSLLIYKWSSGSEKKTNVNEKCKTFPVMLWNVRNCFFFFFAANIDIHTHGFAHIHQLFEIQISVFALLFKTFWIL